MKAIWTGALSFGLINIPVSLYSASQDRALHFKLVHKTDSCPIGYEKVCKSTGKEIPNDEIAKAYELENGEMVMLEDSDFKKANAKKTSTIDIDSFADEKEIDPLYYEKAYYIEPAKKAEKAYVLLREALKKSCKVGVATFVMREKEKLAIIRASEDTLMLEQLHFHDEIRDPKGLHIPDSKEPAAKEMEIAELLIEKLSGKFNIKKFKDTYVEDVMAIINEKAAGKKPKQRGTAPSFTDMHDMMAMLKKSLEKSGSK